MGDNLPDVLAPVLTPILLNRIKAKILVGVLPLMDSNRLSICNEYANANNYRRIMKKLWKIVPYIVSHVNFF